MPARRKTIAELKQSGTFRPSRHGQREAAERQSSAVPGRAPPVAGEPPQLPADVAAVRAELVALLGSRLTGQDEPMLVELAERVVEVRRLREASRAVAAGSVEAARLARVLAGALAALDRLAAAFGLTPGSRLSLPATPKNHLGARTW